MSVTPTMGVVTPEAVVLEFRAAGLATRSMAKGIDVLVEGALLSLVLMVCGFAFGESPTALIVTISIAAFVLIVLAPALFETFWNGRTPGKAVLGLRVVTTEGGPISFRHAILRGLLQIVELPLGIAVFVALANRRSQRLGDLAAGTFVISERAAVSHMIPTVFFPPPGCEAFCHTLDVSRVDSEQFLLVRNFLLRVTELDAAARYELSVQLATPLRDMCTPHPPAGMTAEVFLICVCSAYQIRHGGLPDVPLGAPTPAYGPTGAWVT
ncbi:MAG: RDD family protein [Acidimicrobiales bacterium]